MDTTRNIFRAGSRLCQFGWMVCQATVDFALNIWLRGKSGSVKTRAAWQQRCAIRILDILNVQVERRGAPPQAGLLACNHLGYLDIIVLAAAQPMVFVSKHEVRNWPVFGQLARGSGTLFLRRGHKSDVVRLGDAIANVVNDDVVLGLFPEGTSSDGTAVLPFHSSLFQPAAAAGWTVSPAWLGYSLRNGSVKSEICYWGDMTFVPHFWRLMTKEKIQATVVYGGALPPGLNRKQMALRLREQVCGLANDFHSNGQLEKLASLSFSNAKLLPLPLSEHLAR